MLRQRFGLLGVLVLLAWMGAVSPASAQQYTGLFVFGDSLSDSGNLFALSGDMYPPPDQYYQGRFSNGPVWVEDLAPKLGLTYNQATNFALAGSGSGTDNVLSFLPGMQQQITQFTTKFPVADPNALYIVWAGANDYLAIGHTDPTVPPQNIGLAITTLAAEGAKHFLVPNLPDMGDLPSTLNTPKGAALSVLAAQHDANLAAELNDLRGQLPQADITSLDVAALFSQAIADPAQFGLTNVTDAALTVGPADPDTYLFWDGVHPSARGHQLIAQYAYATLVPEPDVSALALGLFVVGSVFLRSKTSRRRAE